MKTGRLSFADRNRFQRQANIKIGWPPSSCAAMCLAGIRSQDVEHILPQTQPCVQPLSP